MKKLFIAALAVAAFTSCSQDEVVEQQQLASAIAFDGAFVDNATRAADPSTTTDNIKEFDVWAFMDQMGGDVFNEEQVTKNGTDWTYTNTQYWAPNHIYYFAALSPCVDESVVKVEEAATDEALKLGLGKVTFKNEAGKTDLIYDALTVETTSANYMSMPKVGFTFKHLLSKVKFTFKNGFNNTNNTITIKNLKMTVPGAGTIDLATDDWWTAPEKWVLDETATATTLNFGDVNSGNKINIGESKDCADERLTIPAVASQKYNVTFDVVLYSGEVNAFTRTITTTIEGVALEMGKAYNFTATLDYTNIDENPLKPIEFEVLAINEWDEVEETEVITTLSNVTVAEGETLTLPSDAVVEGSLYVTDGTFNGAGHTLTVPENKENITNNGMIRPSGNATISNVTIDGKGLLTADDKNLRAFYITKPGTYNIDGVVTTGTGYALNAQGTITLNVINSTLEGWTSYGGSTTATFKNVHFTKGEYEFVEGDEFSNGYFRPYGTTTLTNCTFEANGYTIDLSELGSGKTITFDNCYVGETKITEDNINTLVSYTEPTKENVTVEFK